MTARRLLGAPFAWLFGAAVRVRQMAYDRRWMSIARVSVPVISVGNISTGGTGKTPFVEWITRILQERGLIVGVLSRGYGRKSRGFRLVGEGTDQSLDPDVVGDEPAQLALRLQPRGPVPAVVVAVDEDRVRGARKLIRDHRVDVIVLDDGFQHRRLSRDLDIALVTADEVLQGGALLPAGSWREPFHALERAGAIVVTKCDSSEQFARAGAQLPQLHVPVTGVRMSVRSVFRAGTHKDLPAEELKAARVYLFAGIAQPDGFRRTVTELGAQIVSQKFFRDHHRFSDEDLDLVQAEFERSGASILLTTEKDLVRLRSARARRFLDELPVTIVAIRLEFVGDVGPLESLIKGVAHVH